MGFPCGAAGKDSACNAGDLGLIPGLETFPSPGGEGGGMERERLPIDIINKYNVLFLDLKISIEVLLFFLYLSRSLAQYFGLLFFLLEYNCFTMLC